MTDHATAQLDPPACRDLELGSATEWLETDGVGGFASSTVIGLPTRRYHALLVATPPGSAKRHVFVSRIDPTLTVDGGPPIELACFRWSGAPVNLAGVEHLESFRLDPHPVTTYRVGGVELRQELLMLRGTPATACRYSVRGASGPVRLRLRIAMACREADRLHFHNADLDPSVVRLPDGALLRPYRALPPVAVTIDSPAGYDLETTPVWLRGVEYSEELARGYDGHEDLWCPLAFEIRLPGDGEVVIAATIDEPVAAPRTRFIAELQRRRDDRAAASFAGDPARSRLAQRGDDFLYRTEGRLGICAGFPWFGEWGRDTFVSLPGLTLARGRVDACAEVLAGALPFLRDGLLPNIYATSQADSHYGSVDAALWYARAVDLWRRAGGDDERYIELFGPALVEIASAYHDGTSLGIRARDDDLLVAGAADLNATWMDAQTPDGPVTPRDGMPVEIEALWLSLLDQVTELRGDASAWAARRDRAFATFVELFWLREPAYLADRIDPSGRPDARVRPNMVLAAGLSRTPLTRAMRQGILERTDRDLLTPRGLRTLSPTDPDFVPVYRGTTTERDRAYHQGTVWPWLLGAYVDLALSVHGRPAVPRLRRLLDGFAPELDRAGLDHVSEVFDGAPPHRPGGTIAQAWSAAELLRAHRALDEVPQ